MNECRFLIDENSISFLHSSQCIKIIMWYHKFWTQYKTNEKFLKGQSHIKNVILDTFRVWNCQKHHGGKVYFALEQQDTG